MAKVGRKDKTRKDKESGLISQPTCGEKKNLLCSRLFIELQFALALSLTTSALRLITLVKPYP